MDIENDSLDINIDDLFKDPTELETQDNQENNQQNDTQENNAQQNDTQENELNLTEAMSKRINEVKQKTELDTQNKIAKELGYENYAALQQANNKKVLQEAGLDSEDEDIMAAIDKIVERRLSDDPRFKKLVEIEETNKNNFVSAQLQEINKFAGTNFTNIDELPKETLSLWEKTGNLKQAYLATEGEALLLKKNASQMNGTLDHLANRGISGKTTVRPLTNEEKAIWRSVIPDITDEELSKKTMNIE